MMIASTPAARARAIGPPSARAATAAARAVPVRAHIYGVCAMGPAFGCIEAVPGVRPLTAIAPDERFAAGALAPGDALRSAPH